MWALQQQEAQAEAVLERAAAPRSEIGDVAMPQPDSELFHADFENSSLLTDFA